MKSSEYLSSDILEDGHLKAFSPFRVIQMILGSCRVDAKYRFVTSPTIAQKIYTIICLLICFVLHVMIVINFLIKYFLYPNVFYLTLFILLLHYATYAFNIIHVRFINNECNVKLYVRLQKIDRKLKIDKNNYFCDVMFKANLVTVTIIVLLSFCLFAGAITENVMIFISVAGPAYSHLTCTLELLNCSNLIIYFYIRLRYINAIITNHLEGLKDITVKKVKSFTFPSMEVLRYLAADTHDFESSDTDIYLKDIFEEFFRFQVLYRFQILLFCFKFFMTSLLTFEFGLLALQYNLIQWFEFIILPSVTAIDLIIIIVISIRCEAFFREIKNTKYLCIKTLSLFYNGSLRRKSVKMLKMINEKPPQFSVYDMWQMKATTMMNMMNLITTLIVTLLQFALL